MASDRSHAPHPEAPAYPPGFMVLHGNRLEDLRDLLTRFLRQNPLGPLQPEVILVQSNGMKHWLEMALADDAALGVCAATRMELPSSFLWQTYRQVLGPEAVPFHLPFDKTRLLWRLMRLLPVLAEANPVYAPLRQYLQAGEEGAVPGGRRLYQLAQQVADVLDGYQSYRADWLDDWARGQDRLRGPLGQAFDLPQAHRWQAQLWRDIRADVGPALAEASRAAVHARFCQVLDSQAHADPRPQAAPPGLPARVVVFGISALPMQSVEALARLGTRCQVLMLVQNPCQHYWGDLVEGHDLLRRLGRQRQQRKPGSAPAAPPGAAWQASLRDAAQASHPLLASWGKQGRDYLHLLDEYDRVEDYRSRLQRVDAFVDPADGMASPHQLAQLQSAVLHLTPPAGEPLPLAPDDDSIQVVSCHSPQREVEVLHDQLLAWFQQDDTLQPRDVMVMVPDMEVFAPYIHAVFGRFPRGQARHIPYAVADTTARQSPLVQALEQILSLPGARMTLVDWLSLLEVDAVRHRFGLHESDLETLQEWLLRAGVRWGLDARHRKAFGVADLSAPDDPNTWAFGVRRLLLGYALGAGAGEGEAWCQTLPQAAIGSLDAALASSLLAWLDAVSQTLQDLAPAQTPNQWGATLSSILERFFRPRTEADERQLERLRDPLEAWLAACADAALDSPLPLEVVREHWLADIAEGGLHQRFFGGGVQFGTLMPMRSIPFRVICLLGMNDGDYPRQTAPRDFDLMAHHGRAGDRSRREDDRYLFLEALLSARDRLYLSWQGHRATDNAEQPPSVLVAQLLDYLKAGWSPPRAVQRQPLQPFSAAYFRAGSGFRTFDADWARLQAGSTEVTQDAAPAASPGALQAPDRLTLEDLQRLLRAPVEVFFQDQLQVRLQRPDDAEPTLEPFALHPLERYQISQALLRAPDPWRALSALRWSGQLPLAAFGEQVVATLQRDLHQGLEKRGAWRDRYPGDAEPVPVALALDGITLSGSLQGLWAADANGQGPWLQLAQRLGAVLRGTKGQLAVKGHVLVPLWVRHLAACALGHELRSVLLGLDGYALLEPLPAAEAQATLQGLCGLYQQAWQRPVPIPCKTGWAFLVASRSTPALDPHHEARAELEGGFNRSGEWQQSSYLQRVVDSYDALAPELPAWAEALYGPLWQACRLSRFGDTDAPGDPA